MALDERHDIKARRKSISTMLRGELSEPLTRQLNERVDCSIIPEKWEGKVLKIVSNKVGRSCHECLVQRINRLPSCLGRKGGGRRPKLSCRRRRTTIGPILSTSARRDLPLLFDKIGSGLG